MEETKSCPFCGKEINKMAKMCIHCGNWIDKTIQCPTCGETIKASAKVCRFCKQPVPHKLDLSKVKGLVDFKNFKKLPVIIGSGVAVLGVIGLVIFNLNYVPPCDSGSIYKKVANQLSKNSFNNVSFDFQGAVEKGAVEKGRSCRVKTIVNDTTYTFIEYKYTKKGFGLTLDSHFALPDCYDTQAKKTVESTLTDNYDYIKDQIKGIKVDLVEPNGSMGEGTDSEEVYCKATGTISYKPGWGYDEDRKLDVNYTIKHCETPYNWCVSTQWRAR